MTVQHIADPERGALEGAVNAGLERDGISQRICLHADGTATLSDDGLTVAWECDYCPQTAVTLLPDTALPYMAPWYWSVKELKA